MTRSTLSLFFFLPLATVSLATASMARAACVPAESLKPKVEAAKTRSTELTKETLDAYNSYIQELSAFYAARIAGAQTGVNQTLSNDLQAQELQNALEILTSGRDLNERTVRMQLERVRAALEGLAQAAERAAKQGAFPTDENGIADDPLATELLTLVELSNSLSAKGEQVKQALRQYATLTVQLKLAEFQCQIRR